MDGLTASSVGIDLCFHTRHSFSGGDMLVVVVSGKRCPGGVLKGTSNCNDGGQVMVVVVVVVVQPSH